LTQVESYQEKNLYPDLLTGMTSKTTYPGTVLTHRYQITKQPRQVVESSEQHSSHIASELNFNPVTTLNYQNKTVHVKPLKNTTQRHISPLPIKGSFELPIRGERVFQVSSDFQRQLQKRVANIVDPYKESTSPKKVPHIVTAIPAPPVPTDIAPPVNVQPPPFTTKTKPRAYIPPIRVPAPIEAAPTQGVKISTDEPVQAPRKTEEINIPAPIPTAAGEKEAEVVTQAPEAPEADKSRIYEESGRKVEEPAKEDTEVIETLNKLKEQLSQETLQKNVTQERIGELSDNYQSQIAKLIQENKKTTNQIEDLKNKLAQETKNRIAAENRISTATNPLITDINKLKIERDGLLGQVKESKNKLSAAENREQILASSNVQMTKLKAKLAQIEREKSDVENKAIKYENLINELRAGKETSQETKEIIVPQPVSQKADAAVRIIEPSPAIGKMAPQLTTIPNVVNGIIKDGAGMLLTDVIIVVKDSVGNPVRALKSNKIGQFAISTPLPNGTYTMELENQGNEFDVVQIKLDGKLMPPIEIRGK